jgi:2'-5' RNA ligase
MRLFTAVDLTDEARAAVAAVQDRLRPKLKRSAIRWVRPEQLHLTLVFIGDIEEAQPLVDTFRADLPAPPFRLGLGGLGMFPPHGAPRVLWLGALQGAAETVALHFLVSERLAECGVPRPSAAFTPHLTLARWRSSRPSDRRTVDTRSAALVAAVDVSSVTLYQSQLSPGGSVYTPLAAARLAGGT